MKRLVPGALVAIFVLLGAWVWMKGPTAPLVSMPSHVARATTALAAVLEAAGQVADDETAEKLRRFQILQPSYPAVEYAFPQRQRLVEAVRRWPTEQKEAAFTWVRDHATWSTLLHAMAVESFDGALAPTGWGPSMGTYAPVIFEARAGLSPLLQQALADPAIVALAEELSAQQDPFTAAGTAEVRQKILAYLRVPDDLPPFAALFAPLMAPGTGVNGQLEDGTVLFLVGPLADPVEVAMVLSHEMAHQPIFRIVQKPDVRAALTSSACAFETVADNSGYVEWPSYLSESLVRSLSYRLEGLPFRASGIRFEEELYRELEAWEEESETDFAEALVGMLGRIREAHCAAVGVAADETLQ